MSMPSVQRFESVVKALSHRGTAGILAYGSGIFAQSKLDAEKKMLDLIVLVKDDHITDWHHENLQENPNHYSTLAKMMIQKDDNLRRIQASGCGVYFNTGVQIGDDQYKYGVVPWSVLNQDLREWQHGMYVAGRLQKPVQEIVVNRENQRELDESKQNNYENALRLALLMLPEKFDLHELLVAIVRLSYVSDPRMGVAEDPKKVSKIVENQFGLLSGLYQSGLADRIKGGTVSMHGDVLVQDKHPDTQAKDLIALPADLVAIVRADVSGTPVEKGTVFRKQFDWQWYFRNHFEAGHITPMLLQESLTKMCYRSHVLQTLKGLVTVKPSIAASYVLRKMKKRFLE